MKTIVILIITTTLMASCAMDTEIDWNLKPHADMLVVDGAITNEMKQHAFRLTLSNPYFKADEPRAVSDAIVYVSEGNAIYTFSEMADNPGLYKSELEFSAQPSKTYKLTVRLKRAVNGQTEYSSTSTMPAGLDVDSIKCEIYKMPEFRQDNNDKEEKDTTLLAVYYFGKEPDSTPNYYLAKAFRNEQPLMSEAREFLSFENSEKNETHLNVFVKNVAPGDLITFRLYTINRDYFNYLEAIKKMDETGQSGSMSGPPANAVGNIPQALGYFLVSYVSMQKEIAIDKR